MKRVLFLCTGNSCRSIIAEALLNHYAHGMFQARSAGSHPTGKAHPAALKALKTRGISTKGLESKSWDRFAGETFDLVITTCDDAAGETCPAFGGDFFRAHWPLPDPAKREDDDAFERACDTLERRIQMLIHLPFDTLPREELQHRLNVIGTI